VNSVTCISEGLLPLVELLRRKYTQALVANIQVCISSSKHWRPFLLTWIYKAIWIAPKHLSRTSSKQCRERAGAHITNIDLQDKSQVHRLVQKITQALVRRKSSKHSRPKDVWHAALEILGVLITAEADS
jgi:hypothetical protein